jgi:hypothetical protein
MARRLRRELAIMFYAVIKDIEGGTELCQRSW